MLADPGVVTFTVGRSSEAPALALVGALTAGLALGFLPWNAVLPRLFLGDSGSYLFGGLATLGLLIATWSKAPLPLVAAPLVLYGVDASVTLMRRAIRHEPLLEAHRDHVYQQLSAPDRAPHWVVALGMVLASAVVTVAWLLSPIAAVPITVASSARMP